MRSNVALGLFDPSDAHPVNPFAKSPFATSELTPCGIGLNAPEVRPRKVSAYNDVANADIPLLYGMTRVTKRHFLEDSTCPIVQRRAG